MDLQFAYREIASLLQKSTKIAVLTGAGVSAESGVPTFRDAQEGLWADYDPQELATEQGFRNNPKRVWEWYDQRRKLIAKVSPNPGHEALAHWEQTHPEFFLITQNIDNLHQKAGSQKVIELHGNIYRNKCLADGVLVEDWEDTGAVPPRCPRCGSMLRPDVVWFGELLPEGEIRKAYEISRHADIFFSIGTSSVVEPAASLPIHAANAGAKIIEINREETALTPYTDIFLKGPSEKILPELLHTIGKRG